MSQAGSSAVLSVRMSANERSLVRTAADRARTTASEFVRRRAVEAAEQAIANHPEVIIAASDWARFEAWADAPARVVPALCELAASPPVWQD